MATLLLATILAQVSGEALDRLVAKLDAKAQKLEAELAAKEKTAVRVGATVSRLHARDARGSGFATFRFELDTRVGAPRNRRDFVYGDGDDLIRARVYSDDEHLVWDLGRTAFDAPATAEIQAILRELEGE
jgi:hypothetical protein